MGKKQKDLAGGDAGEGVTAERTTTVTLTFLAQHFYLRVGKEVLATIREMADAAKRYDRLRKKVKPLPDVESIPAGARKQETEQLLAAALVE
jgi:hypothetical protein